MMKQTPPLSTYNVKPSQANHNKNKRGALLLGMLPGLLINTVAPALITALARPHMSTANALFLASVVPGVFTLGKLIVKKRVDAVGVLITMGLLVTAVFALLFKSPRLLLLVNGLKHRTQILG